MNSQETIAIFDSLSHPSLSTDEPTSFAALQDSLTKSKASKYPVSFSCAIGLEGRGGYTHDGFINEVTKHPNLIAIAAYEHKILKDKSEAELLQCFSELKAKGYKGIKVHPVISEIDLSHNHLDKIFSASEASQLPVFLCTYCYKTPFSLLQILKELLPKFKQLKLVLVHGGATDLLAFSELTRNYNNLLLDLSFTFIKYEGSSIDMDIKYLFENFDRRICVGADFPDFNHQQLSTRFDFFAKDIASEKLKNIAHKNLANFLGVTDEFFKKQ